MQQTCRFTVRLLNMARVKNDDKINCGLDEENEKFRKEQMQWTKGLEKIIDKISTSKDTGLQKWIET